APEFENAQVHDPAHICCLCGSCHDAVTRRQRSKSSVIAAYKAIQEAPANDVAKPIGPLDFYGGNAILSTGGLRYGPLVQNVLRYYGRNIIRVVPGVGHNPGTISAIFTDDSGAPTLKLIENAWEGSITNWDIEVVGQSITVRRAAGMIVLKLRLD